MADNKQELELKAKHLIDTDYVVWLTTVDSKLIPQPRPVWFIWDGEGFLIFSQAKAFKLRHIQENPNVSVHFNPADFKVEENIIIYLGIAQIDNSALPAHEFPAYLEKYKDGIKSLGTSPEEFSREYSVAIRIKPTGLRGW